MNYNSILADLAPEKKRPALPGSLWRKAKDAASNLLIGMNCSFRDSSMGSPSFKNFMLLLKQSQVGFGLSDFLSYTWD